MTIKGPPIHIGTPQAAVSSLTSNLSPLSFDTRMHSPSQRMMMSSNSVQSFGEFAGEGDTVADLESQNYAAETTSSQIRCGRFRMCDEASGAFLSTTIAEVAFVPHEYVVTPKTLMTLIKDKWKLTSANMLLNCDAGSIHPKVLATKKLSSQPQFDEWMRQSKAQLKKTQPGKDLERRVQYR